MDLNENITATLTDEEVKKALEEYLSTYGQYRVKTFAYYCDICYGTKTAKRGITVYLERKEP